MSSDILIIDDEADIRDLVAGILEDEGYKTRKAGSSDEALAEVAKRRPQMIFLDIWLQGSKLDGLQILDIIHADHPELPVVMISGHGNIETAVSAIKKGAYDFIEKPFKADRLVLVAARSLEASTLRREVKELKTRSGQSQVMVGKSGPINQLRHQIDRVAPTNARVLISGGPGSGKELAARVIHAASARADGPFIVLNAAMITPESMEEALFGVEGGDGRSRRTGALEEAHGGTLYLDEVADMPRETQNKILRVLTDQNFARVGGSARVYVDLRIVSSSSRDLSSEIQAGRFREDLYHRLAVVPISVPRLAERRDDIPDLIDHFMTQLSTANGIPKRRIGEDALAVLQAHDWPGNIRQLRNNIERLMIMVMGEEAVSADMLPSDIGSGIPPLPTGMGGEKLLTLPLREAREIFEKEYLMAQISRLGGNISRTAEFIGMERSALHRKLKSLGVG
jgi:two-component system, NtrC family, nitrogen regulation response regulator NtrX